MIILSLGHSILYVTMKNLIQCMGDIALMPKICENSQFLGPLEPRWDPISFSRHPMNDYFIFGTLNHVCTKEKFDSMYGWYGSNGHYMWNILVIFDDFLDLWRPDGTPYPSPDALWMIILSLGHSIMCLPMRNLIQCMGDMALMPKICEK